jgi:tetratricopeptide (TPR) repeat protein
VDIDGAFGDGDAGTHGASDEVLAVENASLFLRECGEELVRRRPELADGYLFLGASARAAGRMDESLAMFEQALAREPEREIAQRFVAAACDAGERPMGAPEAAAGAIRTDAP